MVPAGAQRAPGLLIVVDRMPAHARARRRQRQRGVSVVGRSGHGRPLYAGRLTFHPRRTARPAMPAGRADSQIPSRESSIFWRTSWGGVTAGHGSFLTYE